MIIDGFDFKALNDMYHFSVYECYTEDRLAWHDILTLKQIAKIIKVWSQDLQTGKSLKLKIWRAY